MKITTEQHHITYDVSFGKENYSQRNNEYKYGHPRNDKLIFDWKSACNVTSMVMALDYAGWIFPSGDFRQPEDNLASFIMTNQEVNQRFKDKFPSIYKNFHAGENNALFPHMIHTLLAYGTNLWIQADAVKFVEEALIKDIFTHIHSNGLPCVLSGTFPYLQDNKTPPTTIGHINVLVGLQYFQSTETTCYEKAYLQHDPVNILIDDPFGDPQEYFSSVSNRNNIYYPYEKFITYYKPLGDKRRKLCHFIQKAVNTI